MRETTYIQLDTISDKFHIELELCREFAEVGLIRIIVKEDTQFIEPEEIPKLQKIVHLYRDLGVNREGIEVILPMRDRILRLQEEIKSLRRIVDRYEREYLQKNIELPRKRGQFYDS